MSAFYTTYFLCQLSDYCISRYLALKAYGGLLIEVIEQWTGSSLQRKGVNRINYKPASMRPSVYMKIAVKLWKWCFSTIAIPWEWVMLTSHSISVPISDLARWWI